MRRRSPFVLVFLVVCVCFGHAETRSQDDLIVRAIRARGFETLYGEVAASGSLFGLTPDAAVSTLFRTDTGLAAQERDAVLLLLLVRSRSAPETRSALRDAMILRVERIDDWSLIAEVLASDDDPAARAEPSGAEPPGAEPPDLRGVHLELAARILAELRDAAGTRTGYERTAIVLAGRIAADARARTPERSDAAGYVALAETLTAIARLSRNAEVVDAARAASRALLAPRAGPAN